MSMQATPDRCLHKGYISGGTAGRQDTSWPEDAHGDESAARAVPICGGKAAGGENIFGAESRDCDKTPPLVMNRPQVLCNLRWRGSGRREHFRRGESPEMAISKQLRGSGCGPAPYPYICIYGRPSDMHMHICCASGVYTRLWVVAMHMARPKFDNKAQKNLKMKIDGCKKLEFIV